MTTKLQKKENEKERKKKKESQTNIKYQHYQSSKCITKYLKTI